MHLWQKVVLFASGIFIVFSASALGFAVSAYNVEPQRNTAAAVSFLLSPQEVSITARAAVVYDVQTGTFVYVKNENAQLPLASITKLMLAVVVAETLRTDHVVTISPEALAREGDSGLIEGEGWLLQDLIDFTLIESSNDGAEALAREAGAYAGVSGKTGTAATLIRMNEKAKELGLSQTYFLDPSGLDESVSLAGAYGSAIDIARLLMYVTQNHLIVVEGTARDNKILNSLGGNVHEVYNTNDALGEIPGLIAGKTGFTDLAGGNLAVAFDAGINRPVIVVILGSTKEGRFDDMKTLVRATRDVLEKNDTE
jgi:D-alanyl-D-alanine carboxypeptidase